MSEIGMEGLPTCGPGLSPVINPALFGDIGPIQQIGIDHPLFKPAEINTTNLATVLGRYGLTPEDEILVLPFGPQNGIGFEGRKLYFEQVVDPKNGQMNAEPILTKKNGNSSTTTRIVSVGDCNVCCPYCKRDCQFIDDKGQVISAVPTTLEDIARLSAGAVERDEVVRFSGGDPVTYPMQVLGLAEFINTEYGRKVSIAHNGSGPGWVRRMLPYLSSAAIDLKGTPEDIAMRMGIESSRGPQMYANSLKTQEMLTHNGVLLDVRTPIFGDSTLERMMRLAGDITRVNDLRNTFWTWRLYKPVDACNWPVPDKDAVTAMMLSVSEKHPDLWLGMRAKWTKGGMLYIKEGNIVSE